MDQKNSPNPQNSDELNKEPLEPKDLKKDTEKESSTTKPKLDYKSKPFIIGCIIGGILLLLIIVLAATSGRSSSGGSSENGGSYEEYDLKGLTVKEACEKARGAGWKVNRVVAREGDDKTDCYNEEIIVTYYDYYDYNKSVTIYFGDKKSEEEKRAECEAEGKWYRDNKCKSQEEWENDYAWSNAHAACKKYGASAYAKTLTDCYLGNDYVGAVDGQPQPQSEPAPQETPAEPSTPEPTPSQSPSSSSASSSSGYEAIYNEYAARLRSECPNLSMMECAELSNEGVEKMAEYMWRASGKDGQYETYSDWASKLYDVYMAEAR